MKSNYKYIVGLPLIVLLILNLVFYFSLNAQSSLQTISHRGAAGLAPENTQLGIETAILNDAKITEVDVRRTKDGVWILMHDERLTRTTNGSGKVSDRPWEYIRELKVNHDFEDISNTIRVPTLNSVLEKLKSQDIRLIIEIKGSFENAEMANEILAVVEKNRVKRKVIFASFDQELLKLLKSLDQDISIGLFTFFPKKPDPELEQVEFVGVNWSTVFTTPWLVKPILDADIPLWVWTVNSGLLKRKLARRGVKGIITDRPDIEIEAGAN